MDVGDHHQVGGSTVVEGLVQTQDSEEAWSELRSRGRKIGQRSVDEGIDN